MKQQSNDVSWNQINNWLPILVATVTICGFLFTIKIDQAKQGEQLSNLVDSVKPTVTQVANHEVRISVLETKKTSMIKTSSATAVPAASSTPHPVANNTLQMNITQSPDSGESAKLQPSPTPFPSAEPEPSTIPEVPIPSPSQILERIGELLQ